MNAFLFVAQITNNRKIRKWCFIKRGKQLQKQWAKEKAAVSAATVSNNFDEIGW